MNIIQQILNNEEKLREWQAIYSSPVFQAVLRGIRQAMPCIPPNPADCSEGALGVKVGTQTTRDAILDNYLDPDYWTTIKNLAEQGSQPDWESVKSLMIQQGYPEVYLTVDNMKRLLAGEVIALPNVPKTAE